MEINYSPRLLISVPWDDNSQGIPYTPYEKASLSGMFIHGASRLVRPLFGIRIDRDGNGYIAFDVPQMAEPSLRKFRIFVFDKEGRISNSFDLRLDAPNISLWQIIDFRPDHEGGIFLLELLETKQGKLLYRLRRSDGQAKILWEKFGSLSLKSLDFQSLQGRFEEIITPDRYSLFLPARYPQQGLAQFDIVTGELCSLYVFDELYDKLTMDHACRVYYSLLLSDASRARHVLVRFDIYKKSREVIESEVQYLHNLAGVDDAGRIYPRIHSGIARLAPNGRLQWQLNISSIVVRSEDRHIFICNSAEVKGNAAVFTVDHFDEHGKEIEQLTFSLTTQDLPTNGEPFRLVYVTRAPLYYFYAGETDHQGGTMFVFDGDGSLQKRMHLEGNDENNDGFKMVNDYLLPIESRTGSPNTFEIDGSGSIYIPLSDPEGFTVIRLTPIHNDR
jgi:hypothetical protein